MYFQNEKKKKKLRHGRDSIQFFSKKLDFLSLVVFLVEVVARKFPSKRLLAI